MIFVYKTRCKGEYVMSMTKETLFKIVEDVKMEPLIDEEVSGKQFGWRKMTTERLPQLEALNGPEVKVEVHQIAHTYRYSVYCPLSWFNK